jgi:hypothetical protein
VTLSKEQTYILAAFSAHVGWMVVAIAVAALAGLPWWYGALALLPIAVIKETLLDPLSRFEGNPFWNGTLDSGAFDLCGYLMGVPTGYAALLIARWVWSALHGIPF